MTHLQLLNFAINKPDIAKPFFEKLNGLENDEANALVNMNGGYAIAYINNFYFDDSDAPYIDVTLESGTQDEYSSDTHAETYLFDIQTLEWRK